MDLSGLRAIDGHAHPLLEPSAAARLPYPGFFTEGDSACAEAAPASLFYVRSLREIAAFLGCASEASAIRAQAAKLGFEPYARRFMEAAKLDAVLLDEGYPPHEALASEVMGTFVRVHRVLRLERLAEELLAQADGVGTFVEMLRARLEDPQVVAFKSIAAYRCGLSRVSWRGETVGFGRAVEEARRGRGWRLTDPSLVDLVLHHALDVAGRRRVPVQFHCGFGDVDLQLPDADPGLLGGLASAWPLVPIVLLHGWPYARSAGWMASVHANVYADFGLSVPFCSTDGMRVTLTELLHLAPLSKILYSSDASAIPELYWLGSMHARRVLAMVLASAVGDGDLTATDADHAAEAILRDNALRLYGIAAGSEGVGGEGAGAAAGG